MISQRQVCRKKVVESEWRRMAGERFNTKPLSQQRESDRIRISSPSKNGGWGSRSNDVCLRADIRIGSPSKERGVGEITSSDVCWIMCNRS